MVVYLYASNSSIQLMPMAAPEVSSRNAAASPARQSASSAEVISIRRTNRPIVPNTVMDTIRPSRARPVPEGVVVVFIGASGGRN